MSHESNFLGLGKRKKTTYSFPMLYKVASIIKSRLTTGNLSRNSQFTSKKGEEDTS